MNLLSHLIFSLMLDIHGYNNVCNLVKYSNQFELIHIDMSARIPYRSFKDYMDMKYRR